MIFSVVDEIRWNWIYSIFSGYLSFLLLIEIKYLYQMAANNLSHFTYAISHSINRCLGLFHFEIHNIFFSLLFRMKIFFFSHCLLYLWVNHNTVNSMAVFIVECVIKICVFRYLYFVIMAVFNRFLMYFQFFCVYIHKIVIIAWLVDSDIDLIFISVKWNSSLIY